MSVAFYRRSSGTEPALASLVSPTLRSSIFVRSSATGAARPLAASPTLRSSGNQDSGLSECHPEEHNDDPGTPVPRLAGRAKPEQPGEI